MAANRGSACHRSWSSDFDGLARVCAFGHGTKVVEVRCGVRWRGHLFTAMPPLLHLSLPEVSHSCVAERRIALELSIPNPHPPSHARPEPILRPIYQNPFERVVMDIPDLLRELAVSRTLRSKPPPFCQNRGRLVASLTLDRMGASRTAHRVSTRLATDIFMLTCIQSSAESLGGRHKRCTCSSITTHANTSN